MRAWIAAHIPRKLLALYLACLGADLLFGHGRFQIPLAGPGATTQFSYIIPLFSSGIGIGFLYTGLDPFERAHSAAWRLHRFVWVALVCTPILLPALLNNGPLGIEGDLRNRALYLALGIISSIFASPHIAMFLPMCWAILGLYFYNSTIPSWLGPVLVQKGTPGQVAIALVSLLAAWLIYAIAHPGLRDLYTQTAPHEVTGR